MLTQIGYGAKFGLILGAAYILNVYVLSAVGLGLTGWVFAVDTFLLAVVVGVMATRDGGPGANEIAIGPTLVAAIALVAISSVVQQLNMVLYTQVIDPEWVNRVVEMRRAGFEAAALTPDEVDARMSALRSRFGPRRMMTTGLVVPSLWRFLIAAVVALATRLALRFGGQRRPAV